MQVGKLNVCDVHVCICVSVCECKDERSVEKRKLQIDKLRASLERDADKIRMCAGRSTCLVGALFTCFCMCVSKGYIVLYTHTHKQCMRCDERARTAPNEIGVGVGWFVWLRVYINGIL